VTCADIRPRLSAYYDDELDPDARAAVATHLAACAACRSRLQQSSALSDILRTGRACDIPLGLWQRIETAARRRRPPLALRWLVRVGAAAAGIALYLLAYEAAMPPVSKPIPPVAAAPPVEQLLRDTASALSGRGLHDEGLVALNRRPELTLLWQFTEDAHP
jgi:anti-sigma factor RsiW